MKDKEKRLLELIYLPIRDKPYMSPIQIMKAMFLIKQGLNLQKFYDFEPYLYGPCSFEIYSDLLDLKNKGLIDTVPSPWGWKYYRITAKGNIEAEKYIGEEDEEVKNKILEIKKLVVSKSFLELLRYVYKRYPEYAINSIINIEAIR